jgi:hypothetical protein
MCALNGSQARRAALLVLVCVAVTFGLATQARADDVSVRQAIEYQDAHALKLSPQLKAALRVRDPTGAEQQTVIRLTRQFAVRADGAATAVARTTASTSNGRQGKTAWVQSVRDLAQLYRDLVTQLQDLAAGNSAGAKRAQTMETKEQTALTRLSLEAQRDLDLPKGD